MIMKKYVQNFWVRFLAVLLCSVTTVTAAASGILLAGVSFIGSDKEIYEDVQEYIAENYAAYIYKHIYEGEDENAKVIEEFLKNTNMTCSVGKVLGGDVGGELSEKEETVIYNNLQDVSKWDYEFNITDGSYVRYNVDSVLDALRVRPIIESFHYTEEVPVTGYYFEEATGLFYYKAGTQYFLADYVLVSLEGNYYDYKLKNTEDGKKIYYNSYYDINLDTSAYREWDWVEIDGHRLLMSMEKAEGANEISVITDSRIKENLYTGIYYVGTEDNTIVYYPERIADIYIIRIKVNEDVTSEGDMFLEWKLVWETLLENKANYEAVLIISVIFLLIGFALLIYSAKEENEDLGLLHRVPVGCLTGGFILIEILLGACIYILLDTWNGHAVLPYQLLITVGGLCVFCFAFFAFIWIQNIITRFKTKTFIRYSELHYGYRLLKWCWGKWKWLWQKMITPFRVIIELARENTKLFTKGLVIMLVIAIVEFMAIICFRYDIDVFMWLFIFEKIIEFVVVSFVLLQMQKLQEGSKRIAAGDLSEPIDTSKMFWEFKRHGENINKVSDGIALAVEDRMKSERFKTELITNVSHDIKTPLTSIINYVDLIKKEEIQDETLQEYIDVLDRQSARLKKLIEDLMEASKASTGNLAVNLEECDVEVLLTQIIGEFEDKLIANQLEVVVQKPEHPVIVSADGRHLWRVLDNLLNNACKYSLPGTRVYISLVQLGNEAVITFKNISKVALNIPSEELMERFVRGDSSRNTEGSGLGLSIAQSLTELMNGSMQLDIDGDLFKVTLRFQATSK